MFIFGGFILSLVSIPQVYSRPTSDVNGFNFSVSRQLCSLGNACSSKPPKYTFKSCSTRLTSLLTLYQNKIRKLKHQSNRNEISRLHLAGNWRPAHVTPLLTSGPRFTNKEKSMENSNFYQGVGLTFAFWTTETTISIKDSCKFTRPQTTRT